MKQKYFKQYNFFYKTILYRFFQEEKTDLVYKDHILPTLKKIDEIAKSYNKTFLVTDVSYISLHIKLFYL